MAIKERKQERHRKKQERKKQKAVIPQKKRKHNLEKELKPKIEENLGKIIFSHELAKYKEGVS